MRQFCTFLLLLGFFSSLSAQNNAPDFWKAVSTESITLPATAERKIQPSVFNTYQLNYDGIAAALALAPMEFTASAKQQPVLLNLPQADGTMRTFRVWESPVMAPELAAKYPGIRTYAGNATDGSGTMVRLGTGYKGFYAFMFPPNGDIQSVRPYADGQNTYYMAYHVKDLPRDAGDAAGICGTEDQGNAPDYNTPANKGVIDRGNAQLQIRKYRAAISAQGEYSLFHGGTKPLVMNAIVEAINFIVAIQERDFAVRLELIPNNDTLIYLDPATDPFSGPLVTNWMQQNPAATNPLVGVNNYDIGHVFCRVANQTGLYVAGQASLGGVCSSLFKARAGSSLPSPTGESFYMIVVHEMGHQFSDDHTFSNCPPSDDQTAPQNAYEPGSGSTIMSYAGTCTPYDVQNKSDGYFHIASIVQERNFITQGNGSTCGTLVDIDNTIPEASISIPNNLVIPIRTPFQLTGSAVDPDADALTYCWEEYDLGPQSPLGDPQGNAPAFRSFPPTTSPSRIFPRLQLVLANGSSVNEVLPDTTRNFTFRMTVRDNHAGGGGVDWKEIKFKSTYLAGPFRVTFPNSNTVTWNVGEYQTVTWDVANTDAAPVNCKTVNILLSTNAGSSFPIVLASGVPNIGRCCIRVPDNATAGARIRVEAADNIFLDISNSNFKIQQPTQPTFSFCPATLQDKACVPSDYTMDINTDDGSGATDPITFSATGLPAGAVATFSPNPAVPGANVTMSINFPDNISESTYDITIDGTANGTTKTSIISLTVIKNDFSGINLQSPANGAQSVDLGPTLYWNGAVDADKYEIQVATSPSFDVASILSTNANLVADSFKVPVLLNEGQVIYWRIRPINGCGEGDWTDPYVFITRVQNCASFTANDLPKNISANGTPTVESQIVVSSGGVVSDVNVKTVQGNHQFFKDLEVRLLSPAGTNVLLFKDKCASYNGNFNIGFDDSANGGFPCPPNNGNSYAPTEPLSAFIGQNAAGTWTLRVKDNTISSGGQLSSFELQLCSSVALNPPVLVNNNLLQVVPGTNAPIGPNLLKVEDANNTPSELTFTLMTIPQFGDLRKFGGAPLAAGDQFTQSDIDNGAIRYYEYGFNTGTDDFTFSATDGEGGLVTGTFNIQPFPVGTKEPNGDIAFQLAPNPAHESLRLSVSEPLDVDSRVTVFNTAGQQLRVWTLPSGTTTVLLDIAGLPEGVYAVSVQNEKSRGVKKIVVQ